MPVDVRQRAPQESTVFFGSQLGGSSVISYSYTDSPLRLLMQDATLCIRYISHFPSLFMPLTPWQSGAMDELYPSTENITALSLHFILLVGQCCLIATITCIAMFPTWLSAVTVGGFILFNNVVCRYLLNSSENVIWSNPDLVPFKRQHNREQWIFINGVATGKNWLQNSVDRLALTFGRPVMGIHNRTFGLIFDLVECLIQRSFGYATQDIRLCYSIVKRTLYNPDIDKVIIIAHSQGGIVASMVADWALQELPQDLLSKVEVYTFGSAANHFNSPARVKAAVDAQTPCGPPAFDADEHPIPRIKRPSTFPVSSSDQMANMRRKISSATGGVPLGTAQDRTIGHIEHYAHTTEYVSLFSVLHFATVSQPRNQVPSYMGRVFARTTTENGGHQFVQHYMDGMFPLTKTEAGTFAAAEESDFMNSDLRVVNEYRVRESPREIASDETETFDNGTPEPASWLHGSCATLRLMTRDSDQKKAAMKVKDLSRLWQYRNGRKPEQ